MEQTNLSSLITISLVSHNQGGMIKTTLEDLTRFQETINFEVILTVNTPERLPFKPSDFPYPMRVIENSIPHGFGANHNAAFLHACGKWFCVMNPDIRMPENPFPHLLAEIERFQGAVIAPLTLSPLGQCEDSMRRFPTAFSLLKKAVGAGDGRYLYAPGDGTFPADWVGGMFMLFRTDDFRRLNGFDEGFFLYYEDVDICVRLWKSGGKVLACPGAAVVHDAQRASRRKARYMRWHVSSMARYFIKHWLRLPKRSSAP